jgi:DNA-binding XRE family transcriptional regulator
LGFFSGFFSRPSGLVFTPNWATIRAQGSALAKEEVNMSDVTFAVLLKRAREAAGLSQPQLAERAGMNRFGIAKLEQGVREPTWQTVQAIASALGLSCRDFEAQPAPPVAPPAGKRRGRGKKGG